MDAAQLFEDFVASTPAPSRQQLEALCSRHPQLSRELEREYSRWSARAVASVQVGGYDASGVGRFLELLDVQQGSPRELEPLGEIATGGMGVVELARDRVLRRKVATKRIRWHAGDGLSEEDRAHLVGRLVEEAQVTAQLDHPGIVPVHDLILDKDGELRFTMKLVEGETFEEFLTSGASSSQGLVSALQVLVKVTEALAFAHDKGVIHRDLKPSNIMVGAYGEAFIMDWGLAHLEASTERESSAVPYGAQLSEFRANADGGMVTLDGVILGSPGYMSPEQARGSRDALSARSDVFALGALLYRVLTGFDPYGDHSVDDSEGAIDLIRSGPPTPLHHLNPEVNRELAAICEKAMEREPAKRYASAADLGGDLRAFLDGRVVEALNQGRWGAFKKWVKRNPMLFGVGIAALIATVATGVIWARLQIKETEMAAEKVLASRRLTAEQSFKAARLQLLRGEYEEALESLARSESSGYERRNELLLTRSDALMAQERKDEAHAILAQLEADLVDRADGDDAKLLGRVLVRLGSTTWVREDGVLEHQERRLKRALALGVPPAEDAIARAFLSLNTGESIDLLQAGLREEPFHRGVYGELLGLLLMSGRFDELETEARVFELMFPEDPLSALALALSCVFTRDLDGMRENLARVVERMPKDQGSAALEVMEGLYEVYGVMTPDVLFGGGAFGLIKLPKILNRIVAAADELSMDTSELTLTGVPGLQALFTIWLDVGDPEELRALLARGISLADIESAKTMLDSISKRSHTMREFHTDGIIEFFAIFHSLEEIHSMPTREEKRLRLLEIIAGFEQAALQPTLLPVTRHLSRFWALRLRGDLYRTGYRPELRSEARERFQWFLECEDLGLGAELDGLVGTARMLEFHDVVLELADRRIASKRKPRAADFRLRFEAQLDLGRFADAEATLGTMAGLRRPPEDLEDLRAGLDERVDAWLAARGRDAK